PPPSRASASYARSAPVLPLPLGPVSSVSAPRGSATPRCPANAESSSSVTRGRPGPVLAAGAVLAAGVPPAGAAVLAAGVLPGDGVGGGGVSGRGRGGEVMGGTLGDAVRGEPFRSGGLPTIGRRGPARL